MENNGTPTRAGALMVSLFGLILSGAIVAGAWEGSKQEAARAQAKEAIANHKVYIDTQTRSLTFALTSTIATPVYLYIPKYNNYIQKLYSVDNISHATHIANLPGGNFEYFFVLQKNDATLRSETFSFHML